MWRPGTAEAIGARRYYDAAQSLGFRVLAIRPADRRGPVARLAPQLAQVGYGQGELTASPLQVAQLVVVAASGGAFQQPRLVAGVDAGESRQIITPERAGRFADALCGVVASGTATNFRRFTRVQACGKTGTAERKLSDGTVLPSHSWFAGYSPGMLAGYSNLTFSVLIEGGGYGALAAVPAAARFVEAVHVSGPVLASQVR